MEKKLRKTAIDIIGNVPWGTHFCQFYQTKEDLIEILVPYFKSGLENNEFCMWITSEPLNVEDAKRALKKKVNNLDEHIKKGQIEILDYKQWYTKSGCFDSDLVLQGWVEKEQQALQKGFDGLRLTGNTFWLEKSYWKDFVDYEATVNSVIGKYRMLAICTYCLDKCSASEIMDVVSNHQFALIKREGIWEIIESAEHRKTINALSQSEQKFRLTFENAIDAIFWADTETGLIINCNKAAENLLEKKKEDIIGKHQTTLHPPEKTEDYAKLFEKHVKERKAFDKDAEIITSSGKIKPVNITASITSFGEKTVMQGIFHDITERKQTEKSLQESKRQLSTRNKIAEIFLTTPDDQMYAEVLQVLLEAMESKYGIFGYIDENENLIIPSMTRDIWKQCQIPDKTIVYPREKWGGIWGRALKEKKSLYANEGLHVPEGHVPITKVLVVPVMYGGQVIGLLEVANKSSDYSHKDQEFLETIAAKIAPILNARLQRDKEERERKQAVEALKLHEVRLQSLLNLHKMAGATEQKILNFTLEEVIKVTQSRFAFIGFMNEDESIMTIYTWSKQAMPRCAIADKPIHFPTANAGLWAEAVRQRKPVTINNYSAPDPRKKGYPKGHIPIKRLLTIPIFDGKHIIIIAAVANKEKDYVEADIRAFTSMMTDMWRLIQHKRAEEQIKNLAKFPTEDPFPVLRIARDCTILYSNDAGTALLSSWQRHIGEYAPNDWCQLINDTLDSRKNKITEVKYGNCIISFVLAPVAEAGYVNIYGRDVTKQRQAEQALQKAYEDLEKKVKERTAELSHMIDMLQEEIRERTLAEQALQQSEARLRDAQRIAHIGNWDWDIVHNKLWWSNEIYHIFGLKPQEFGATYEAFLSHVHPDDREFVKQSVNKALYEHKLYSIDHRVIRPDGTTRIVHEQAEVNRGADKKPIRMRGTVQDITEKKQAEEKILENQKQLRTLTAELLLSEERERRKIATDLHDSIGQILAFSDRELGSLQKSIPQKLTKSVDEIRHHIKRAVKQTRTLTFDLSPPTLYDLSFEAAVEELAEQFSNERKIKCIFESCGQHKSLTDHVKILLYRSIRELLANVAKHSTANLVRITSSKVNNNLQIIVQDDGTGFDISTHEAKTGTSKGFGLFSIRERLKHIGGQLSIKSDKGKGTKISLLVPLKPIKLTKRRTRL